MKIVILSTTKSSSGGVERFSFYLKQGLLKDNHTVSILSKEDIYGSRVFLLGLSKYIGMGQPVLGYFLGKMAEREGFDVCVTNGMLGWNIKNRKIINVQHGTFARAAERIDKHKNIVKFFIKRYIWGYFESLAGRRATQCVAVSEETKESVEMYYGVKNVKVILNGVDTDFFKKENKVIARKKLQLSQDKNILLFVGRFEYAKGQEILEAIQNRLEEINAILIIAEHYSQEQLVLLYSASDLFLLPSLHEGCSYALLDAMSVGLPFVASPVGLVDEFVNKKLFEECIVCDQNIETYIKKINFLLHLSNTQKDSLTRDMREYILSSHSILKCENEYNKLFMEIS